MGKIYKNIKNGKEVSLSALQYSAQLANLSKFENIFFKKFNHLIESYTKKVYSKGSCLFIVKYKSLDKPVCILWRAVRNSGIQGNDNKRIQVSKKIELIPETPYYAIGAYNTVDSNLYALIIGGITEFIKNARKGKTYSSLWIDYPNIYATYKKGSYEWRDGAGRTVIGCKENEVERLHMAILNSITPSSPQLDNNEVPFIDFSSEMTKYQTDESLPRNPQYRELAFIREDYTCEICGTKTTFQDQNNTEYFEGHHLIMYNLSTQRRYQYCLDHPDNIVCLCPKCHREIHHGQKERKVELLVDLFSKHHSLVQNYKIKDLDEIITDYTKE